MTFTKLNVRMTDSQYSNLTKCWFENEMQRDTCQSFKILRHIGNRLTNPLVIREHVPFMPHLLIGSLIRLHLKPNPCSANRPLTIVANMWKLFWLPRQYQLSEFTDNHMDCERIVNAIGNYRFYCHELITRSEWSAENCGFNFMAGWLKIRGSDIARSA